MLVEKRNEGCRFSTSASWWRRLWRDVTVPRRSSLRHDGIVINRTTTLNEHYIGSTPTVSWFEERLLPITRSLGIDYGRVPAT